MSGSNREPTTLFTDFSQVYLFFLIVLQASRFSPHCTCPPQKHFNYA